MKDFGAECRDVRFREVGVRHIHAHIPPIVLTNPGTPTTPTSSHMDSYCRSTKSTTKSVPSLWSFCEGITRPMEAGRLFSRTRILSATSLSAFCAYENVQTREHSALNWYGKTEMRAVAVSYENCMCTALRFLCMAGIPQSFSIRCINPDMPGLSVYAYLTFAAPQGFGTLLMEEAERIAREEHGSVKIAVISGKSAVCFHA
jgi:hypothetical protein